MTLAPSGLYFYAITGAPYGVTNAGDKLNVFIRNTTSGTLILIDALDIPANTSDILISSDGLYLYTMGFQQSNGINSIEINTYAIGITGGLTSTGTTYVMETNGGVGKTQMIEATDGTAIYCTRGKSGIVIDKNPTTGIITGSTEILNLVLGGSVTIAAKNSDVRFIYVGEYSNKSIVTLSTLCPP